MLDVNNICRICLREEDPKLPIFTENGEKTNSKPTLPEKIMSFAQVKVAKDDGLSSFICVKCYCQVDETFEFIKLCEESFQFVTRQLERYVKHKEQEGLQNAQVPETTTPNKGSPMNGTRHLRSAESAEKSTPEKNQHADGLPTLQIASTAGNVQAWSEDPERNFEVDTSIVKSEPNWSYDSNDERFDGYDSNEENMAYNNFMENGGSQDESNLENESAMEDSLSLSPNSDRVAYKCKSCKMNFNSRKEMGIHISTTHRRCGTCGKYFFSNKHKDGHVCTKPEGSQLSFARSQFCKICKMSVRHMRQHRTSSKHKEAVTMLRKLVMRKSLEERRKNREIAKNEKAEKEKERERERERVLSSLSTSNADISVANTSTNVSFETSLNDEKVVCHLCDLVCSNQRGFKTHMTCMHRNYKIVYFCKFCPDRVFQNRVVCEKHLIKKHAGIGLDSIPFQFKPLAEIESIGKVITSPVQENVRRRRGAPVNKFECMYCSIKYLTFIECQNHLQEAHKTTNAQKIRILREYMDSSEKAMTTEGSEPQNDFISKNVNGNSTAETEEEHEVDTDVDAEDVEEEEEDVQQQSQQSSSEQADEMEDDENIHIRKPRRTYSTYKKPSLPTPPSPPKRKYLRSHPPFNAKMPVVANNFSIVLDDFGVKEYRCNGCNSVYNRYISAYNHYYTLSKKFPMVEKKQLPDSKPFGCKICTLKFASRGQAVSHRLNAHKLFYSQLKAARRNKLLAQAETEADFEIIEERLKEF